LDLKMTPPEDMMKFRNLDRKGIIGIRTKKTFDIMPAGHVLHLRQNTGRQRRSGAQPSLCRPLHICAALFFRNNMFAELKKDAECRRHLHLDRVDHVFHISKALILPGSAFQEHITTF
jgi:hypothetical protein